MKAWAFVPARGGSKSIPRKNLALLGGLPLLDYGILAAKAAACFDRILCSTDDDAIGARARHLGVEVDRRPAALATDDASVADVVLDVLSRTEIPDVVVLVQPTSPFVLPEHIQAVVDACTKVPGAKSAQTITECPHNHHAWNQRETEDGCVRFRFREERLRAFNKQQKPKLFVFGNLLGVNGEALVGTRSLFADPSVAIEIPRPFDLDVDTAYDLQLAEAMLLSGMVRLDHLKPNLPAFNI